VVHRDLKPSNVFLTSRGLKLLDFGLARDLVGGADQTALTQTGIVLGTPRYMAPEQVRGESLDGRADLFSVGAILFEALAGRPAFEGKAILDVLHAVVHEQPPALVGSPAVEAVDRVLNRALSKSREQRPAGAAEMASELRECLLRPDTGATARARALRRFIALPLRVLRADPETDFLAVSLPDAVSASLAHLESVVVRSTATAARFAGEAPDLERLSREAEVDAVLLGTLLRAGSQLRVTTQLVEAPSGTVIGSHTAQVAMTDIFQLQDDLAQRIVQSLELPLSTGERQRMRRDAPRSPHAYEAYLRANEHYQSFANWSRAYDLYQECLSEDPDFAPAWARVGRLLRVKSKFGTERVKEYLEQAEHAFQRALELNPDLSLAHREYAALEDEMGRGRDAMVRLLGRASGRVSDAETYAALCRSLRYCGLLEPSIAAHAKAKRIDPSIRTSVTFSHYFLGQYQLSIDTDEFDAKSNTVLGMFELGRVREAEALCAEWERSLAMPVGTILARGYRAAFARDRTAAAKCADELAVSGFADPEGWYLVSRNLARCGDVERALIVLEGALDRGFVAYPFMGRDPWLESLRDHPEFTRLTLASKRRWQDCVAAYRSASGERILGTPAPVEA
jgi:serine/threonine-protein kinase